MTLLTGRRLNWLAVVTALASLWAAKAFVPLAHSLTTSTRPASPADLRRPIAQRWGKKNKKKDEEEEADEAAAEATPAPVPIPTPRPITMDDVDVTFSRSGGAGGQNVNKVNTKAEIRFDVKNCLWIALEIRAKLMELNKNRINKDGVLVIASSTHRTQLQNQADALARVQQRIDEATAAAQPPKEASDEKKKKIKKLKKAYDAKRLDNKKKKGEKKAGRRSAGSGGY